MPISVRGGGHVLRDSSRFHGCSRSGELFSVANTSPTGSRKKIATATTATAAATPAFSVSPRFNFYCRCHCSIRDSIGLCATSDHGSHASGAQKAVQMLTTSSDDSEFETVGVFWRTCFLPCFDDAATNVRHMWIFG